MESQAVRERRSLVVVGRDLSRLARALPRLARALSRSSWARALTLVVLALFAGPNARAQKLLNKDLPPNHPENDPYTRGDPELMKAAGLVSHGGFEFGESDTPSTDQMMGTCDIRWLETEHFELGFALGPYRVPQKEKKVIQATLERLAERLPAVKVKAKLLDPWLRAHMYAMRLEDMYADFLELIQLEQSVFPDGSKPWDMTGTYQGEGPYLGQKGKFEVIMFPSEANSLRYLSESFGLQIKRTQRWNVDHRDSLTVTIHLQQGSLRDDPALHGHLAFNMIQNMYDGLRHYSYNSPIWLKEGLAHWAERRVTTKYNTFDGGEGSVPEESRKSDWKGTAKKIASSGKASRMAALIRKNGYGELSLDDHFVVWSMIDFLHTTRPEALASFLCSLKGQTNAEGLGDGSDMPDMHRAAFKEHLGMSYSEFDKAWNEWVTTSE